eukprot:CAMPEP_0119041148 /NCGR_PEP_ID=MMETSP1177-20130426/11334_1 /TAXON_ID=2985 /ORGANISM="Ochromonas sp, Strain CCMP1899" /LENGTH=409 /DNA_ID=CAMNT_0007006963 /DNA_START=1455 /DNA_END=2684 /DNA_ORIENTATION=+
MSAATLNIQERQRLEQELQVLHTQEQELLHIQEQELQVLHTREREIQHQEEQLEERRQYHTYLLREEEHLIGQETALQVQLAEALRRQEELQQQQPSESAGLRELSTHIGPRHRARQSVLSETKKQRANPNPRQSVLRETPQQHTDRLQEVGDEEDKSIVTTLQTIVNEGESKDKECVRNSSSSTRSGLGPSSSNGTRSHEGLGPSRSTRSGLGPNSDDGSSRSSSTNQPYDSTLIGRKVRKKFDVGFFIGVVDHYVGRGDYMIMYEDDDSEHMHGTAIRRLLLPVIKDERPSSTSLPSSTSSEEPSSTFEECSSTSLPSTTSAEEPSSTSEECSSTSKRPSSNSSLPSSTSVIHVPGAINVDLSHPLEGQLNISNKGETEGTSLKRKRSKPIGIGSNGSDGKIQKSGD